jgi:hypothetical protein
MDLLASEHQGVHLLLFEDDWGMRSLRIARNPSGLCSVLVAYLQMKPDLLTTSNTLREARITS